MSKFYITTPLYYVNASPHIGHAYTNVICDCLARFRRLKGDEVFFLTGTDEHGEKIKKAAQQQGSPVDIFVSDKIGVFKDLWKRLNISYDYFIRTTDSYHKSVVKKVITNLYKKGDVYKAKYRGFYCMPCESFWTELQVKEVGGCPTCKRDVEEIIEDNYFFKLSKYEEWLREYLRDNPNFIQPRIRYNEVVGFLENNKLEDLCISRPKKRVSWGIDFPLDDDFVVYVWFDALLNYISAVGFEYDYSKFKKWWPADIQFIGKDILRHHAIFWPIMLHALDIELPRIVFAHGWWKVGEDKISKSKGNIVNPLELIDKVGVDALRYFLLREVNVGADGNFSWDAIVHRLNSDLANDLGNLVYRTLNMAEKYFEGKISSENADLPYEFKESFENLGNYISLMEEVNFIGALEGIWKFINAMNKFIEDKKPWVLWKDKKVEDLKWFLFSLLEGIKITAVYIYPFMPQACNSILSQLGKEEISLENTKWKKEGFSVRKGLPLFPRIDVD